MRRYLIPPPLALLVLPLLVLLGIDTVVWFLAVDRMESGLASWLASRPAAGWTVAAAAPRRGGWPLRARLTLPSLALEGGRPDLPQSVAWQGRQVSVQLGLLHPATLVVSVDGPQMLRLGQGPEIPFRGDAFTLAIGIEPGAPPRRFDLMIDHLRAGMPGSAGAPLAGMTLDGLQLHAETRPASPQGEAVLSLTLAADGLDLPPPPAGAWPLGPRIDRIVLDGMLTGPLPRTPGLYPRAAGWRDGGGTLEIKRLALAWGALHLGGTATIALDDRMQPMGAATAHVSGQGEALDAMAAAGALKPAVAAAAKGVLALMAHPPESGGPPEVDIPLTLQDQTLSVGRFPLARLPDLRWPDAP